MKKLLIAFLALMGAGGAMAAVQNVEDLNNEIIKILAPYQNANTVALLSFGKIEINAERALKAELSAYYQKLGSQNTFEIQVPFAGYDYNDGKPVARLSGSVKLDLTKLLPQDQINDLVANVEAVVADLARQLASDYGDAVSVVTEITDREQDENGNFTAVKGSIRFVIDMSKLPENKPASEVPLTDADLTIALNVATGFTADLRVAMNTSYKGFASDQTGLKEYLESLLSRDPATIQQLSDIVKQIDETAGQVVGNESRK